MNDQGPSRPFTLYAICSDPMKSSQHWKSNIRFDQRNKGRPWVGVAKSCQSKAMRALSKGAERDRKVVKCGVREEACRLSCRTYVAPSKSNPDFRPALKERLGLPMP